MDKSTEKPPATATYSDVATAELQSDHSPKAWLSKIAYWGVELRGIAPVPLEERVDKRYINVFFVWFTMSTNLLPWVHAFFYQIQFHSLIMIRIVTGMVGTLSYGLSLRDSSLVIIFFSLLCTIPPAFLGTFGAKTGLRQMLQARFTFG